MLCLQVFLPPTHIDKAPSDMTGPTLSRKNKILNFTSYQELLLCANVCREAVMKFVCGVHILYLEYRANLLSMLSPFYAVPYEQHPKKKCTPLA